MHATANGFSSRSNTREKQQSAEAMGVVRLCCLVMQLCILRNCSDTLHASGNWKALPCQEIFASIALFRHNPLWAVHVRMHCIARKDARNRA